MMNKAGYLEDERPQFLEDAEHEWQAHDASTAEIRTLHDAKGFPGRRQSFDANHRAGRPSVGGAPPVRKRDSVDSQKSEAKSEQERFESFEQAENARRSEAQRRRIEAQERHRKELEEQQRQAQKDIQQRTDRVPVV